MIKIPPEANQILNIIKARYGLKTKSEAITRLVIEYGSEILEPELRPEYIKKLRNLEDKGEFINFNSIESLKKVSKMHKFEIEKNLHKTLKKLAKKNKERYKVVLKKINEIINNPDIEHYKNLKFPMNEFKRVHLDKSFVLIFKYNKTNNRIKFYDLDHHDKFYK